MAVRRVLGTVGIVAIVAVVLSPGGAAQDQKPAFKSGVELVLVDAQVVDKKKGEPIPDLTADKFQVTIDGKKRNVVTAEFIDSDTGQPRTGSTKTTSISRAGNVYLLAVDQGSFRPVNAPSVTYAVRDFLKRVRPNDYVGMFSFPSPGVRIDPTRDRKTLEDAVHRLVGFSAIRQMGRQFTYSLSDAIDVASRDKEALDRAVQRNCAGDLMCRTQLEMEMNETISILELQAARSLHGLREVMSAVKGIEGRKAVVVISAGIPSGDRGGGRLYLRNDAQQVGRDAQSASILLYTLQLNTAFLDAHSPDAPSAGQTAMREASVYGRGLDIMNGLANGTFFEINTSANNAVDRMVREMSAHYLLGVEVEEADRDGRAHLIQVKATAKDSAVRNRATVVIPKRAGS